LCRHSDSAHSTLLAAGCHVDSVRLLSQSQCFGAKQLASPRHTRRCYPTHSDSTKRKAHDPAKPCLRIGSHRYGGRGYVGFTPLRRLPDAVRNTHRCRSRSA
jgi:hypothetical protein